MAEQGRLIVVSGFSGAGKGTVVKEVVRRFGYSLSVSATTRAPRPGEVNGREYYFKTVDEFRNLIDYNGFIEWAQYVDNYYGTPRKFVEEERAAGRNVILEIEVQGAMNVKQQYPDAILIFITTKDAATLHGRLKGRGSESDEVIRRRMNRAWEESALMDHYEYIVVNDTPEQAAETIHAIVVSESCRRSQQQKLMQSMRQELQDYKI